MLKELLWLIPVGLGFFSLGFSIANIIWMNWNKGKKSKKSKYSNKMQKHRNSKQRGQAEKL